MCQYSWHRSQRKCCSKTKKLTSEAERLFSNDSARTDKGNKRDNTGRGNQETVHDRLLIQTQDRRGPTCSKRLFEAKCQLISADFRISRRLKHMETFKLILDHLSSRNTSFRRKRKYIVSYSGAFGRLIP